MPEYLSSKKRKQSIGINSYSEYTDTTKIIGNVLVGFGSVGVGTTVPTQDVDVNTIRVRDTLFDYTNSGGEFGYYLVKDTDGIKWVAVPPIDSNAIFIAENNNILGVSSFTGLNIISDELIGVSPNPINPNFADITIVPRWLKSGETGIYTTKNVGIGTTIPTTDFQVGFGTTGVTIDGSIGVVSALGYYGNYAFIDQITVNDQLNVVGLGSTSVAAFLASGGGITTTGGDLYVGGSLFADKLDIINLKVVNIEATGITTLNVGIVSTFRVTGVSTLGVTSTKDLFVDANLKVSGITTLGITSTKDLYVDENLYVVGIATATRFSTGATGSAINITSNTISGPAEIIIDPADVGDNSGAVRIKGDLYVDGEEFIVNSTTIELADFNVGIASTVGTNFLLDGAGIGIGSTNIRKTLTYDFSSDSLKSSENFDLESGKVYKINEVEVLSSTQLTIENINSSGITTLGITTAQQLYVSGVSTFVGVGTFNDDLYVGGDLYVADDIFFDELNAKNANITGITTLNVGIVSTFRVTGVSTLGVTTTTNLTSQQLYVSGLSTFVGVGTFSGNLYVSDILYADVVTGLTSTTDLLVGGDLKVTGVSTFVGVGTFNNDLYVGGVLYAKTVDFDSIEVENIKATGISTLNVGIVSSLTVTGVTTLGVTSTTNLTSQQLNVSGITTLGITTITQLYVSGVTTSLNGFVGNLTGIASTAQTINTVQRSVNATHYLAFVDADNATSTPELLYTDAGISYNPSTNILSVGSSIVANLFDSSNTTVQAPTIGNYDGERLRLYDFNNPTKTNYAIGVENNHIWQGVDANLDTLGFKWYGSTVEVAKLSGTGNLTIAGDLRINGNDIQSSTGVTAITLSNNDVTIADTLTVNGISTFIGAITGTISTATKLETARSFEITGDIVASPIFFDGTGNVSLAATIQPNSVGLGTDTFGDYVKDISGTDGEIVVTGGTGEGSSPIISFAPNPTIGGNVTIGNDLQVNNNLNVTGNITVGGTTATLFTQTLTVADKDIILGFTTDPTDTTANHGGIAIASTEGTPLVTLTVAGIETLPATYKKIMWFKAGSFAGLNTDAWLSNYALGVGTTELQVGTVLAAGSVQFSKDDLKIVRNINASGVITATKFKGTLEGYADSAGIATYADNAGITTHIKGGAAGNVVYQSAPDTTTFVSNGSSGQVLLFNGSVPVWGPVSSAGGNVGYADIAGISSYADNAGVSTNIGAGVTGNIPYQSNIGITSFVPNATVNDKVLIWKDGVPVWGDISAGSIVGVATYADRAGIADNVIGGIASVTSLNVTGITTLASIVGTALSISGISTLGVTSTTHLTTQQLNVSGLSTFAGITTHTASIFGTHLSLTGVVTATEYFGTFKGTVSAGVVTYADRAGIVTYADRAGIATNVIGGIASVTSLNVSGVSTFNNIVGTALSISGISTLGVTSTTNLTTQQLNVSGLSTFAGVTTHTASLFGTQASFTGVVTATEYFGTFKGTVAAGVVTYADRAGISTNVIGGIASVSQLNVTGISTLGITSTTNLTTQQLNVSGLSTFAGVTTHTASIFGTQASFTGVVTATEYFGTFKGTVAAGVVTYADRAGISTYADRAGIATNVIGGIASVTSLNVTGISTFNNIVGTALSISGISTIANFIITNVGTGATVGGIGVVTYYGDGSQLTDIKTSSLVGVVTYADRAGIGTNATNVIGGIASVTSLNVTGITTLASIVGTSLSITGISTLGVTSTTNLTTQQLNVSGVSTFAGVTTHTASIFGTQASFTGVVTATEYFGIFNGTVAAGVVTYADRAGIATYADRAGISTNVIGGIASVTQLSVSGVSTFTNIVGTSLSITGISTIANFRITPVGTGATVGGIGVVTYYGDGSQLTDIKTSSLVGVVTYADRAGIATNVIGGIASVTSLNVSGLSTFAGVTTHTASLFGTQASFTGVVTATEYFGTFRGTVAAGVVTYADRAGIATNVIGGIASVSQLNVTGITTLASIVGTSLSITGISSIANFLMTPVGTGATVGGVGVVTYYGDGSGLTNINLSSIVGVVTYADRAGIATYADRVGIATNVIGGIASVSQLNVSGITTLGITSTTNLTSQQLLVTGITTLASIVGTSLSISGISTIANFRITNVGTGATVGGIGVTYYGDGSQLTNINSSSIVGVITYADRAGVADNVIGGIASVTSLDVSGITTLRSIVGTALSISGISTIANLTITNVGTGATVGGIGVVTYYGDGSNLSGVSAFSVQQQDLTASPVYPTFANGVGSTSLGISTTQVAYIPASGNLGIGTTSPTSKLTVVGDVLVSGVLTATRLYSGIYGEFVGGSISGSDIVGTSLSITGISTLGTVQISSGIITATTGIVTYYGDGSNLDGVVGAFGGIGTAGGTVGTGITFLDFRGAGISSITSSAGIATITIPGSSRTVSTYTAEAGRTSFDATYTVDYVDVYLNGAKLSSAEYTATNGTTVNLIEGASLNDIVEIIGYSINNIVGGTSTPDISPVMMGMIF